MRLMIFLPLAALAACAPQGDSGNVAGAMTNAAAPTPSLGQRGNEAADSPGARAARETVERYFDLIGKKDYAGAYRLWGNDGKDSGGSVEAFAASFAPYAKYEPEAGNPTEIRARDGMQYILVTARAHVENRKTGKTSERSGTVALRRSTDPNDPVADKRDWRIWSVDLRVAN